MAALRFASASRECWPRRPSRRWAGSDRKRGEIPTSSRTFMLSRCFVPRQSSQRSDRRIGRRPLGGPLQPLSGQSGTLQRNRQGVRRQPASRRVAALEVGCHESTARRSCDPDRPKLPAPIKMRQFIFTHTSGPVPRHAVLGVGGCPITRGRGSARGLVQCRRGRTAEQREPVVDPLSGQALVSAGPLVPSPAPRAQIEPGAEQVEKALGGALVDVEIGA